MDRKTPTYGGYSTQIVVTERYALKVPPGLELAAAAPLLCAGITTYSPLKRWKCAPGKRVGVVGLGGLGHMAVKLAASMGAEVTMLSTSRAKEADARRLGAHAFELTSEPQNLKKLAGRFDLLIDTISVDARPQHVPRPSQAGGRDGLPRRPAEAGSRRHDVAHLRQQDARRAP